MRGEGEIREALDGKHKICIKGGGFCFGEQSASGNPYYNGGVVDAFDWMLKGKPKYSVAELEKIYHEWKYGRVFKECEFVDFLKNKKAVKEILNAK